MSLKFKIKFVQLFLIFSVALISIIACKREYLNPYDSEVSSNWLEVKYDTAYIDMNKVVFKGSITKSKSKIIQYGFCWSESYSPTITDKKIDLGETTGTKQFEVNPDSLVQGRTYHFRAFVTNLSKTIYSEDVLFIPQIQLSITNVSFISLTTTKIEGIIKGTFLQGVSSAEYGVCFATNNNPTYNDSKISLGTFCKDTIFSVNILNLTNAIDYYYNVYGKDSANTKYGTTFKYTLLIGDSFQGGKVAYILQSGDLGYVAGQTHGFIAASGNQSTNIRWSDGSYAGGITDYAIGTGNANTNSIVANQGAGNYAAKLCADLVLGGYNDWYLPSKDELNLLYINRVVIGDFANVGSVYWSSSQYDYYDAFAQNLSNGDQITYGKNSSGYVRAIRSF